MNTLTQSRARKGALLAVALAIAGVAMLAITATPERGRLSISTKPTEGGTLATIEGPPMVLHRIAQCRISPGAEGPTANGLILDWGDGSADAPPGAPGSDCSAFQGRHVYATPGSYQVRVRVFHLRSGERLVEDWKGEATVMAPVASQG